MAENAGEQVLAVHSAEGREERGAELGGVFALACRAQGAAAPVVPGADPEAHAGGLGAASAVKEVAIDIETSGLGPLDTVTCVCVCGAQWTRVWTAGDYGGIDAAAVCALLDEAERILAFNGGGFDIPFLQRAWRLPDARVGLWMGKLVDPLYAARGLFGTGRCEKLQRVLERNGLSGKSGSGAGAVELARQGLWHELGAYCAQDTRQTYELLRATDTSQLKILLSLRANRESLTSNREWDSELQWINCRLVQPSEAGRELANRHDFGGLD